MTFIGEVIKDGPRHGLRGRAGPGQTALQMGTKTVRLRLRAKLDAVYFHPYGVTDRDGVRYIYSPLPIVERQEMAKHGRYLSRDLCLAWISALAAGDPDAGIEV